MEQNQQQKDNAGGGDRKEIAELRLRCQGTTLTPSLWHSEDKT